MKIEHVALNVEDPISMTDWYVKNLGLMIVKQSNDSPYMTFLSDDSGRVMIELYNNPADKVPDYRNMNPLIMHLAYVSENPDIDKSRLVKSGATVVSDDHLDDGSHLVMLRDPWGICIQLCKRATPMLKKTKG